MGLCTLPARVSEETEHEYLLIDLARNMLVRPHRRVPLVPEHTRLYHNCYYGLSRFDLARCDTIKTLKEQFRGANQAPMQHKKYKFIEDTINTFREYQNWLVEVIVNAVVTCLPPKAKTSKFFLDNEASIIYLVVGVIHTMFASSPFSLFGFLGSPVIGVTSLTSIDMNSIIQTFKSEHKEFFTNLFRTQLFSAYSFTLYAAVDTKLHYSKETLKKLKELIAMEEKSKEVLLEYGRCGVHSQV